VIAGSAGGLRLNTPKGLMTRPTADKIKEALFNIIANRICDASVLDLFAGTGSLGIEALSRGAKEAVFVDKSRDCGKIIANNLSHTGFVNCSKIITSEVQTAIDRIAQANSIFDIVFLDPPYGKNFVDKTLKKLAFSDIINENGIVVAESHEKDELPENEGSLELIDSRRYGITVLSLYT
jgi:16S rRNA (guanine966-N2)-methyltransferase